MAMQDLPYVLVKHGKGQLFGWPCLLITFANSLDPDQARQNVGPDMGPICLTLK